MRWKRTWNANSQDKYAGGSVLIVPLLSQCIVSKQTVRDPLDKDVKKQYVEERKGP